MKKANGEIIVQGNELKKQVEQLTFDKDGFEKQYNNCLEDLKAQTNISDGINERLNLQIKETEKWKAKKSIWYRWFGL